MVTDMTSTFSADQRQALVASAQKQTLAMTDFAQRLIQTPSLSGQEENLARLLAEELRKVGCDDVWIDRAGNVVGVIRGAAGGQSTQFNTHMDHVSPGDLSLWSIPPYEARIEDGILYGRGASDVKGAMAAQVYGAAVLRDLGLTPPGDVYIVGVVLEEVGGLGSQILSEDMPTDIAVIGEASRNQLRRGHRGRVYLRVDFEGLSAHASAPDRARNPHYAAARFLLALQTMPMMPSATFGGSSASPTLSETDQTSGNVTPGRVTLFVDWRNIPEDPKEGIYERLNALALEAAADVDGVSARVTISGRDVETYTGIAATMPPTRGFETPADSPVVLAAQSALVEALDRDVEVGTWTFATDGGHLAHAGITCIGFAPGQEEHAHTIWDQIGIEEMEEAMIGNATLALTLGAVEKETGRG